MFALFFDFPNYFYACALFLMFVLLIFEMFLVEVLFLLYKCSKFPLCSNLRIVLLLLMGFYCTVPIVSYYSNCSDFYTFLIMICYNFSYQPNYLQCFINYSSCFYFKQCFRVRVVFFLLQSYYFCYFLFMTILMLFETISFSDFC